MKKFIIVALVAMMLCLAGCSGATSNLSGNNSRRFESTVTGDVNTIYAYDIIVDNETGFQYLVFNNGQYQSMTQMIGADGKPIVAETYGE